VPWKHDFLEQRSRAYDAVGDPLAGRARADLEAFERNEPPSIFKEAPAHLAHDAR
jgi:hypothetical protein